MSLLHSLYERGRQEKTLPHSFREKVKRVQRSLSFKGKVSFPASAELRPLALCRTVVASIWFSPGLPEARQPFQVGPRGRDVKRNFARNAKLHFCASPGAAENSYLPADLAGAFPHAWKSPVSLAA